MLINEAFTAYCSQSVSFLQTWCLKSWKSIQASQWIKSFGIDIIATFGLFSHSTNTINTTSTTSINGTTSIVNTTKPPVLVQQIQLTCTINTNLVQSTTTVNFTTKSSRVLDTAIYVFAKFITPLFNHNVHAVVIQWTDTCRSSKYLAQGILTTMRIWNRKLFKFCSALHPHSGINFTVALTSSAYQNFD